MTPKQKRVRERNWIIYQLRQAEGILNSVEDNDLTTEAEKLECMRSKELIRRVVRSRRKLNGNYRN